MEQNIPASTEPVYVISVAARLASLPCWVLRVLDQENIVVPVRTDSNRRLYSDHDIALLARVRYLTEDRKVNMDGVKVIFEMERAHDAERQQRQVSETADPGTATRATEGALIPAPLTLPTYRSTAAEPVTGR